MNRFSKHRAARFPFWWIKAMLCSLLMVVLCLPAGSTFAATQRTYEYDAKGRLTTMSTGDQKTTYTYDKNGNVVSQHQAEPTDSSNSTSSTDPTLIPPPVSVPTQLQLVKIW